MKKSINVAEIKERVSIEDLVSQSFEIVGSGHTLTTKEHDSLKLFTHNNSWYWYSRGVGGDVIEWYQMANNCDFRTAIEELDSDNIRTPSPATKHQPPAIRPQDDDWKKRARQRVQTARKHLQSNHLDGVEYLTKRALDLDTCEAWGVGFDPMVHYGKDDDDNWQHAPAVMFPYIGPDGEIVGVRYRWLEPLADEQKSFAFGGSNFKIAEFGLHHLYSQKRGSTTLFVVEGEINALSIIQCGYDAVSVGSEASKITDGLVELSLDYHSVVCWMDKSKYAAVNAKRLEAKPVKSPVGQINGQDKELDANDFLKEGVLAEFIEKIL